MSDPVAEALRIAQKGVCCWGEPCQVEAGKMKPPCCSPYHLKRAAITIAAFLRALPNPARGVYPAELAAAVERAAREGRDG